MARSYTYKDPAKELIRQAKALDKATKDKEYMLSEKIDFRRKDTVVKIRNAVYSLTGGVVFDPHKKKQFEKLVDNDVALMKTVRAFRNLGSKTLSDYTFAILNQLGIELTQLQADTLAENINYKYIEKVKMHIQENMKDTSDKTVEDLKSIDMPDNIQSDIRNIMVSFSKSISDFLSFEITASDILSLNSKWIYIQAVIEANDIWDDVFES